MARIEISFLRRMPFKCFCSSSDRLNETASIQIFISSGKILGYVTTSQHNRGQRKIKFNVTPFRLDLGSNSGSEMFLGKKVIMSAQTRSQQEVGFKQQHSSTASLSETQM